MKYGEELERNPEERRKLDREHESEGMKKAMDRCGLDAESPEESRAFAEGVKYGEELERNPEERRKLDREHESEGMKKAMDDEPDLRGKNAQEAFAAGVDYAKKIYGITSDEDDDDVEEVVVKTAQDRALRRRNVTGRKPSAFDAALIEARATAKATQHIRSLYAAVEDIKPVVGAVNALAFDSANDVYSYALKQKGISLNGVPASAYSEMFRVLKTTEFKKNMPAQDAALGKSVSFNGPFANLSKINLG